MRAVPFSILVVCTGNICRSPMAERVLTARLSAAGLAATVSSAGTNALVGEPMTEQARALTEHLGASGADHTARLLTPELVAGADLVLTATRDHRHAVVALHPRAARFSFTLTQFARLVDAVEFDAVEFDAVGFDAVELHDLAGLIAEVATIRGLVPPPDDAGLDDIIDPYRRSDEVYAEAAGAIDAAVSTIVAGFVKAHRGRAA